MDVKANDSLGKVGATAKVDAPPAPPGIMAAPPRAHRAGVASALACCAIVWLAGCATQPPTAMDSGGGKLAGPDGGQKATIAAAPAIDTALEDRILALNPQHITEHDVRTVLELGPSPQLILLHGGVYGTHLLMMSFAKFLIGMGYPEAKIRDPADGSYSQNPFGDSARLAGEIAWYYEHDGVRPMMVGHSQGGIQAVKVLYELNGTFSRELAVWNPITDTAENRYSIVDPLNGEKRPVVGLTLSYVSVVGAGGVALAAPVHWGMAKRLHTVPDTVEDFTGYAIDNDLIAWTFPNPDNASLYRHNGTANVRNVTLPESYSHVFVPLTQALAADPKMRDWLNAYVPGADNGQPPGAGDGRDQHALWAADVWFSIKQHWCLEAQRYIRARRAGLAAH